MTKIDNLNSLLHTLRPVLKKTGTISKAALNTGKSNKAHVSGKIDQQDLKKVIISRISKYKSDNPDNWELAQAISLFLETALTWEFGEDFIDSPELVSILEAVRQGIESNTDLLNEFNEFVSDC